MFISGKICEHSPSIGDMGRFHGSGSCVEDWKVAKSVYSPRTLDLDFLFKIWRSLVAVTPILGSLVDLSKIHGFT